MFRDRVAGVYDLFANVYNAKALRRLREAVAALISPSDDVLECACGTGMLTIIILPTYMNREKSGGDSAFSKAVGQAGAGFKRQFTLNSYRRFLAEAGYPPVSCALIDGRVPCAVAMIENK